MVTEDVFKTIIGSEKHKKRNLLTQEGVIHPLRYPGFSWKFIGGGK